MGIFLGFDTSNYTSSVSWYDDETDQGGHVSRLLPVQPGSLGLRQNDALFAHVKALAPAFEQLLSQSVDMNRVSAVGYSDRPRDLPDSYMPCFLAGSMLARCISMALCVPQYAFSHQQGHIAAAAWSAGQFSLLQKPFLAWHLSGGTTELLHIEPDRQRMIRTNIIGGTGDLTAGQLIDRTGGLLGLAFPAGKALDKLSQKAKNKNYYAVKVNDLIFSLSGLQNKAKDMLSQEQMPEEIAYYTLRSVAEAITKATEQALDKFGELPVLGAGGVMSNSLIGELMNSRYHAVFGAPEYSRDNAMGPALLASLSFKEEIRATGTADLHRQ